MKQLKFDRHIISAIFDFNKQKEINTIFSPEYLDEIVILALKEICVPIEYTVFDYLEPKVTRRKGENETS